MIEIHFTLDGIEKVETAVFYDLKDMQGFINNFEQEVLATYPSAENIRLGQAYVGL
jgi:hypothetical protein